MEHSPYGPPRAEIAEVSSTSVETPLFAVSMVKLTVPYAKRIHARLGLGQETRGAPALRAVNRMSAGPAGNCGSR